VIESINVGTLIGALISGLIGLIIVEYRYFREKHRAIREWYDRTIKLAIQGKVARPGNKDSKIWKEHGGEIYGSVYDKLSDHLAQAPQGIKKEVLEEANDYAVTCKYFNKKAGSTDIDSGVMNTKSENLIQECERAKSERGFLTRIIRMLNSILRGFGENSEKETNSSED
jgi:hypothetical protein